MKVRMGLLERERGGGRSKEEGGKK
jgi:hypothetical protein